MVVDVGGGRVIVVELVASMARDWRPFLVVGIVQCEGPGARLGVGVVRHLICLVGLQW